MKHEALTACCAVHRRSFVSGPDVSGFVSIYETVAGRSVHLQMGTNLSPFTVINNPRTPNPMTQHPEAMCFYISH